MAEFDRFSDVRAVLFDLDGTLIDSAPDLGAAVETMRQSRGMPSLPLAHYRPMAGAGARTVTGRSSCRCMAASAAARLGVS